ncbi:hypothetical protein AB0L80_27765 [Streptomyces sp. NPDC052069]|uniref:hypothetical protein n=1 Tax=Streptomyces sp. NPDC052069 TaxID=3154650 RepID=UPI00341898DB
MPEQPIVVDAGSYSLSDTSIAGAGQRLAEITQVLSRHFRVFVVAPPAADPVDLGEAELVGDGPDADRAVAAAKAVLFFDTADRDRLELAVSRRKLIVGECRAPIEQMDFPSLLAHSDPTGEYQRYLATYQRQIQVSHHFLSRSPSERTALLTVLCAFGRLRPADIVCSRTLDHLVSTVPVGFSSGSMRLADAAGARPMADFLWTGGMWAFYDPLMLVQAMRLLRERGVDATAAFMYARPIEDTRATIELVRRTIGELGLTSSVLLNEEPPALSERDQYVKAAKAFVCITKPGAENETATRLRLRDTWLHGIPSIVDAFGTSGEVVAREGLGVALHRPDAGTLADALQQVADGEVTTPGRRLERLYDTTLGGFVSWLDAELASG